MKLNPEQTLSPATVRAMVDLFSFSDPTSPAPLTVDDDAILKVAMGVADAATRRACAEAIVSNPDVAARLARARRQVIQSSTSMGLDARQLEDLRCLCLFVGPFTLQDAASVFPDRFAAPDAFLPFEARGWLDEGRGDNAGTFQPSEAARAYAPSPIDDKISPGWQVRFVEHFAEVSSRIDRILSEFRWTDASAPLNRYLPNLQRAWGLAADLGMNEQVEKFVRALVPTLHEHGASEAFNDLIATGYVAADALSPKLRSYLLSFEGVAAARGGDAERAISIWRTRVEFNRAIPNPVGESDALLDIAAHYQSMGNDEAFRAMTDEMDRALAVSGRSDLEARFVGLLAIDRLRAGDLETATFHARKALNLIDNLGGIDNELGVRSSASRTLALCGQTWEAYDSITQVLSTAVESGRSVTAAVSLQILAGLFETQGNYALAMSSLETCLAIHQQVGTRHVPAVEAEIQMLAAKHNVERDFLLGGWEANSSAILAEIARIREIALGAR